MVHLHRSRFRSSSRDSRSSQSSSSGRKPVGHAPSRMRTGFEDNLISTVVGPTKEHITRITKRAGELITASRSVVTALRELSPDQDGFQARLEGTDELILSMKRCAHKLGSINNFVTNKFDTPEMEALIDKEIFLQEIRDMISESHTDILKKELQIIIKIIEAELTSLNFPCSQYIQSDGILSDEEPTEKRPMRQSLPHDGRTEKMPMRLTLPQDGRAEKRPMRLNLPHDGSRVIETPILPLASRTCPEQASPTGPALEDISRQKDLEILSLKAEIAKARALRQQVEAETAMTESEYIATCNTLQGTCMPALDRANTAYAQAATVLPARECENNPHVDTPSPATPEARLQHSAPNPIVDAVPNANMTTGKTQQSDLHPSIVDAIHEMHRDSLKSAASLTTALEKLTSLMTDWCRDQEERKYADEYERHACGAGDDDDAQSPPPAATAAEAPNQVPMPTAQNYRTFDATAHLSDYDGSGDLDVLQSTFERVVMVDQTLTFSDKYLLLRQALKGKAMSCLIHADEPEAAIKKTFAALNRAFGHNQTENSLLGKLTRLPFHPSDPNQMRLDLVNITVVIERLKQKGIPDSDKRTIWDIASKLPSLIQSDIADYLSEHENSVTHDLLVEKIFAKINALDMRKTIRDQGSIIASNEITDSYASINHMNAAHSNSARADPSTRRPAPKQDSFKGKGQRPLAYNADAHPASYFDPVTKQTLPGYYAPGPGGANIAILHRTFPFYDPESKCPACNGRHSAMRCNLSSTEFRETLKEKDLCPICAGNHSITQCRSPHTCGYCDGLHHIGACPKKEFYRNPANLPEGVRGREKFFRDQRRNNSQ